MTAIRTELAAERAISRNARSLVIDRRERISERDRADRSLIVRHQEGDADAFCELVQTFRAPVYGYLVRCGLAVSECDDLFQDIFLAIHRARQPPVGPLTPWVFTIVVNTVRSHLRRAPIRARASETTEHEVSDQRAGPEHSVAVLETLAWLQREIVKLPEEQREALLLCAVEGLDLSSAASALGAPVETIKTRLRRARIALSEARTRRERRNEEPR